MHCKVSFNGLDVMNPEDTDPKFTKQSRSSSHHKNVITSFLGPPTTTWERKFSYRRELPFRG